MLGSFLDEHPLISLMEGTGDCPFPSMDDRAAWDGLPEAVRQLRAAIDDYFEK